MFEEPIGILYQPSSGQGEFTDFLPVRMQSAPVLAYLIYIGTLYKSNRKVLAEIALGYPIGVNIYIEHRILKDIVYIKYIEFAIDLKISNP